MIAQTFWIRGTFGFFCGLRRAITLASCPCAVGRGAAMRSHCVLFYDVGIVLAIMSLVLDPRHLGRPSCCDCSEETR